MVYFETSRNIQYIASVLTFIVQSMQLNKAAIGNLFENVLNTKSHYSFKFLYAISTFNVWSSVANRFSHLNLIKNSLTSKQQLWFHRNNTDSFLVYITNTVSSSNL